MRCRSDCVSRSWGAAGPTLSRGLIEGLLLAYRARFGSMPEDLQRLVEATHDPETLRRWGALLLTATPESFAQSVRDTRH
jgi:hypothetical protein